MSNKPPNFRKEWFCKKCQLTYFENENTCWNCKSSKHSILLSEHLSPKEDNQNDFRNDDNFRKRETL